MKLDLSEVFSFSKLSTFSKCPRKYFYRYVLGRREKTGPQLTGRAIHAGQEFDNLQKIGGVRVHREEVLDAAVVALRTAAAEEDVKVSVDPFVKDHRKQLEVWDAEYRDGIRPVPGSVEAPFEMDVKVSDPEGNAPKVAKIQGFIDVASEDPVTGKRTVVDYKSGTKPYYQAMVDDNLQFTLYAMGAEAEGTAAASFVLSGKQKATAKMSRPAIATEARRNKLLTWIADTVHSIRRCFKSGDYPKCDPAAFYCGGCSFYDYCYPKEASETAKVIQIEQIRPVGTVPMPEWRQSKAPVAPTGDPK